MEVEVENTFHAPLPHAGELIWGWEVPIYLFLQVVFSFHYYSNENLFELVPTKKQIENSAHRRTPITKLL